MDALFAFGWLGVAALVALGLCVGTGLTVVIARVPQILAAGWEREAREVLNHGTEAHAPVFSLWRPAPQCPACAHGIRFHEGIPLVGWLLLRGHCSGCAAPISWRYPLTECATALLVLLVFTLYGWTWVAVAVASFGVVLLALACIDIDTRLLPDQLTLPLVWGGLLVNALGGPVDLRDAVLGAAGAYGGMWVLHHLFRRLAGRDGIGYGDFKLLAALGAWLGWQALPMVLMVASATGLVYGAVALLCRRRVRGEAIPFGPFLAAGGGCALMLLPAGRLATVF